jgi:hypothetical protein
VIGAVFGRLTVIEQTGRTKWKELLWRCRCECGQVVTVQGKCLRRGSTRSCGCLVNEYPHGIKHGHRYTRLYRIWTGMITRCENPKAKDFYRYGGAGVHICNTWRRDFAAFHDWAISAGYSDSLTIDRIDSTGNYEPSNCRWVTPVDNSRHTRNTKLSLILAEQIRQLTVSGLSHESIARRFGVSRSNVSLIAEGKAWVD